MVGLAWRRAFAGVAGLIGLGLGWAVWELAKPGERAARKEEPAPSQLLWRHSEGFRAVDAWAASVKPNETADAVEWAHAVISLSPVVVALFAVRDALVRPFGLAPATSLVKDAPYTGFPLIDQGSDEVVLGVDDKHLDFRVGIATAGGRVTVTTMLRLKSALGQLYWPVVSLFHPWLTRAMLRQAHVPASPPQKDRSNQP
ncbi:MAG: DUF2867 domain-containing protein [Bifidobacteriaceae bacterium]|jgi:hypothetical protein|nr:DUF2867 domain-containing protein [Bifidobacteriaceae bacterium]